MAVRTHCPNPLPTRQTASPADRDLREVRRQPKVPRNGPRLARRPDATLSSGRVPQDGEASPARGAVAVPALGVLHAYFSGGVSLGRGLGIGVSPWVAAWRV